MVERRISALLAGLAVLLVCAVLWDAFGGVRVRRPAPRAPSADDTAAAAHRPGPLSETTAVQAARLPAPAPPGAAVAPSNLSYASCSPVPKCGAASAPAPALPISMKW